MPQYVIPEFARLENRDPKQKKRVTLKIPDAVDFNLEIYASITGEEKQEIIKQALCQYLESKGVTHPEHYPVLKWERSG